MAKKKQVRDAETIEYLREHQCEVCPLYETWDDICTPLMEPTGVDDPLIYVLGEAPGKNEDETGEQFTGKAGEILEEVIPDKYLDQITYDNTIRCHKHKNANPDWREVEACRPFIETDIEEHKPKAVLAVGKFALHWFAEGESISAWSGKKFPYRVNGHPFWVFPILHPASTIYNNKIRPVFNEDARKIFDQIENLSKPEPYDITKIFDNIRCLTKGSEFEIDYLDQVLNKFEEEYWAVGIDIETNALRPYEEGAKILSIAIGTEEETVSIPLYHKESPWTEAQLEVVEKKVVDFLYNTECRKVAHYTGFELEWLAYFYGHDILQAGVWDDTNSQFYCLDTKQGATGLDALCLQHFGFNLKEYSPTDVANLDNEPLEDVLKYNGADTKFTEKIFWIQQDMLEADEIDEQVYTEQIERIPALVLAQLLGIDVDYDAIDEIEEEVESKIQEVQHSLKKLKAVKDYEKIHGEFNPNSPQQVMCVLKDFVKTKKHQVGKDKYSSETKILKTIDHKFAEYMVRYRSYHTLKKMFIKPISKNHGAKAIYPDHKIHTNYTSTFTATRRLSSRNINLQQQPKRENVWIRKYIVPPEDHVLISCDYGAIEARAIAVQSQDQHFINALWKRYDIHAEWAMKLYKTWPKFWDGDIDDPKQFKKLRHRAKNEFVFPSFYGADYETCSYYLGMPKNKVKRVQDEFWDTFQGAAEWQERELEFYEKHRYLKSLTGFKYRAPLDINKIFNYPTQGLASDIVVNAMVRLTKYAQETGQYQFAPRINVHDDLVFCVPIDTLEEDFDVILRFMLDVPYEFMKCVPILVEAEIGDDWANMESLGEFSSDTFFQQNQ